MHALVWGTLRRIGSPKLARCEELIGYSAAQLAAHLEKQFLPGMTWEDRSAWHIDHIKPVSVFIAEGVIDVRVINALENLRPLWAADNLRRKRTCKRSH